VLPVLAVLLLGAAIYLLVRFAISLKRKLAQAGTPDKVEVQD
jgi:hypothetical protein